MKYKPAKLSLHIIEYLIRQENKNVIRLDIMAESSKIERINLFILWECNFEIGTNFSKMIPVHLLKYKMYENFNYVTRNESSLIL